MLPAEVTIEFVMDEDYFLEFHEEWVAAVGRNWRASRVLAPLFVVAGSAVIVWGLATESSLRAVAGALLAAFAGWDLLSLRRRKARWLAAVRARPSAGGTMLIDVIDGELVQMHDLEGDPGFHRTGDILDTPRGYLLKYRGEAGVPMDKAISATAASVYIPHRAIQPAMTRAEVRALLRPRIGEGS